MGFWGVPVEVQDVPGGVQDVSGRVQRCAR